MRVLPRPDRIFVSNVGGERIGTIVRAVAIARWGVEPTFVESSTAAAGVRNAYPDVWRLGVDRWLAMIGAYAIHRGAVCVVSIGTAATIDGVDATGRHLGGVIVPGPDLMVDSLLKNTSGIARRAETGSIGSDVFANNTLGAIHQGALNAVAALAERAVESMQARHGERPQLVLTGGASVDVGRLIRFPHVAIPDLVLRGLAVIAENSST
jgi:type III pantothenate kinase